MRARSALSVGRAFCFIGNCVAFPIKQKALRVDRTAAEENLSLRDPPQAENPAMQDSIFILQKNCKVRKAAHRSRIDGGIIWKKL